MTMTQTEMDPVPLDDQPTESKSAADLNIPHLIRRILTISDRHTLSTCMRVNQQWNDITRPLLYRMISVGSTDWDCGPWINRCAPPGPGQPYQPSLLPGYRALGTAESHLREAEWSIITSESGLRNAEDIRIVTLAAHGSNHFAHSPVGMERSRFFGKLLFWAFIPRPLDVVHFRKTQVCMKTEVSNIRTAPDDFFRWFYCSRHESQPCRLAPGNWLFASCWVLSDALSINTDLPMGFSPEWIAESAAPIVVLTINFEDLTEHNHGSYMLMDTLYEAQGAAQDLFIIYAHLPCRLPRSLYPQKDRIDIALLDIVHLCQRLDTWRITIAGLGGRDGGRERNQDIFEEIERRVRDLYGWPRAEADEGPDEGDDDPLQFLKIVDTTELVGEVWAEVFEGKDPYEWL